jgi:translation elongation factor EF-1alpha
VDHVDAGKSTLSGNILYLTNNVDKRTMKRDIREAKELKRESWILAFIMDTNKFLPISGLGGSNVKDEVRASDYKLVEEVLDE